MDYCYFLIDKGCKDQFVLDLAAIINNNELYNIPKKIAERIDNVTQLLKDEDQDYNKIWPYLVLAADMCATHIIK